MAILSNGMLFGWPISAILLYLIPIVIVVRLTVQRRKRNELLEKHGSRPPAVQSRLPFGLDVFFRLVKAMRTHRFFEFTREVLDTPGRTVEVNILGDRMLMTDNVENIKAIQFTQFSEFGKGARMHENFKNILGNSVFSTDGAHWQRNKDELRPHLAKSRPNDLHVTEEHIQRLFVHFNRSEPIEVYDVIDRFQLDMATHVFFGESIGSLDDEEQPFRTAMEIMLRVSSIRVVMGPLAALFPDWLVARKAYKDLGAYMNSRVDMTLALPKEQLLEKGDKMTLMERLAVKQPERQYVRDQLLAVLLASKDPVAITISWILYELSRRRDVWNQIEQEVKTKLGFEEPPDMEIMKELTTIRNAVKETLRLHHPRKSMVSTYVLIVLGLTCAVGINIREASIDTSLPSGGGPDGRQPVAMLKGEQVCYAVLSLQRREAVMGFPDVDSWEPSRWKTWMPTSSQYMPFNIGPRICLGRVFGHVQMEYTVARIVQGFERLEWCGSGEEMRIKLELNTKFDKPILIKFTPRVRK